MLPDARIDEIKWMRDGLPRRSGAIVRQALDDLLAERDELLAELAKPCFLRIGKRTKRPDLVLAPEYYEEDAAIGLDREGEADAN